MRLDCPAGPKSDANEHKLAEFCDSTAQQFDQPSGHCPESGGVGDLFREYTQTRLCEADNKMSEAPSCHFQSFY